MGRIVVDLTGVHGADDRYVVRDGPDFRKLVANALFGFAIFLKGMLGSEALKGLALKLGDRLPFREGLGHGFAVHFPKLGLVVQGLEVRGASGHAKKDYAFGFWSNACRRG